MALSFVFNDEFSEPEEDPLALDVKVDIDIDILSDVDSVVSMSDAVTADLETETSTSSPPPPPLQQNSISKPATTNKKEIGIKRKSKQYICQICSKTYLCKVGLSNHEKQRRLDAPVKCIISSCPIVVCTSFDLQSHYREYHHESLAKSKNKSCSHCSKSFSSPSAFERHTKVCRVRKKQSFRCEPCGRFYRYELGLRLHEQEYHHHHHLDDRETNDPTIGAENTIKEGGQDPQQLHQNIHVIPPTDNVDLDLAKYPTESNLDKKHVPLLTVVSDIDDPAHTAVGVEQVTSKSMEHRCQQGDPPNIPNNNTQVKVEVVEDIKIKLDPSLFC